jgi:hypothetical protein
MSPPVKQQSDTGLPAEMPPPKAPTRAARPTDLWIVDSNSDLRQLEGLADFANLADFASEDTLPPPQPADFVNLADFASEDTLPPPQPPNREGCSALDTFPDEVTLDSPTPTPVFSSPAAARAIRGRATRDRRRYVFFALTSVALLAGVVALETPRLLVEWAWQPLGRTASAPTVSSDLASIPATPVPSPAPRTLPSTAPALNAEQSPLAVTSDRVPPASKRIGQDALPGSTARRPPSAANATPVRQVGTRPARDPESAPVSDVSPVAPLTRRPPLETTLPDQVTAMSSIEALSVVPLPPAPPSVARSADVRAPAVAVVRETPSEQDQVQAVLARYQSAYHRLDAAAAKELWPSLDQPALERAFRNLHSQELQFHECRLSVASTSAIATCTGAARYVTRIGNSSWKADAHEWIFNLKKDSDAWLIESVRMR